MGFGEAQTEKILLAFKQTKLITNNCFQEAVQKFLFFKIFTMVHIQFIEETFESTENIESI